MTGEARRPRVFGTGLIALDVVLGLDARTPPRAWAGGTCGNVLSILASLGWDAYPIARMNGDAASTRVQADMKRWGVHLDFVACGPPTSTPIIVQEIRRGRNGVPTHRFSWSCPRCGHWLPSYKAVTARSIEALAPQLAHATVFFMDRVSRAALLLAAEAAAGGALVVFEPSGRSDAKLLAEGLAVSHIVKYADQRLDDFGDEVFGSGSATLLEVQTLGSRGLRYRHRLDGKVSPWQNLSAVPAPRLSDTCGAGDWCTAGLLAKAAAAGREGLRRLGGGGLRDALRAGQAIAAWNCGFEGARGGMYAASSAAFRAQAKGLLMGRPRLPSGVPVDDAHVVDCPACPQRPSGRRRMA